ncbi:MAG TPA: 3-hydroxyacyl-CoA dehydrogenase NAD-binding domain-containing protein [Chitinophagaceae bacterium]|nr:3-hydroxyacyl-CoA dehydrogenase NAD-binding domain-containing protein [Chitinophagaceae bacterium]
MIHTICICGAGTMGSGIAQVAAQSGFRTILYDVNGDMVMKAAHKIQQDLDALETKNKITGTQKHETLGRLQYTSSPDDCRADVIIEAIIEKIDVKVELFNQLATINSNASIFATNTSSLSVSAIAEKTKFPDRVVGMHFFNPAPIMKLVEVVQAAQTDAEVTETIYELAKQMNKTPVLCKDAPGFIVNHVARPYYLEALKLVEMGVTDFETIDRLMEASGFKMGPFKLMDLIGNDVNYAVSCSVYEAMSKPERLRPSPIQKERVDKGELGRKTGKGYYNY